MSDPIARLEAWLKVHRPDYLASLRPPADEAVLQKLALPAELATLLRRHDGQAKNDAGLFEDFALMPAKTIASTTKSMNKMLAAGEWEDKLDWWHNGWVPFLDDGNSNHLCVDTTGALGGAVGQVVEFIHDHDSRRIVAPDFATWLEAFVSSLEADLWKDDDGALVPTDDLDRFLRERMPGFPIEKAASPNVAKKQARLSAREANAASLDPLTGPTSDLARRVELADVTKASRVRLEWHMPSMLERGEGSKIEGVFEILPAPAEKRVAYALWASRILSGFHEGHVIGVDLKGDDIYKKKAVA